MRRFTPHLHPLPFSPLGERKILKCTNSSEELPEPFRTSGVRLGGGSQKTACIGDGTVLTFNHVRAVTAKNF